MDIHVDLSGFLEIHAWICYEFSNHGSVLKSQILLVRIPPIRCRKEEEWKRFCEFVLYTKSAVRWFDLRSTPQRTRFGSFCIVF